MQILLLNNWLIGYKGDKPAGELTIAEGTKGIADDAFNSCQNITDVIIPEGVVRIGSYSFGYCSGLKSVTIPSTVKSIADVAFINDSKLSSIVSYISADDLYGIPVGTYGTFKDVDKNTCSLYVSHGAKETYTATEGWNEFANIVEMEPTGHDLAVTAAGYATLYLGYNTIIPDDVEVYYAKNVEGNILKMEQIIGCLPANTGVVVKANEGTYTFNRTDEVVAEIEDNLLKGSVESTIITAEESTKYYVLSKVDGVVGMYLSELSNDSFLNNANKAYLELTIGDLGISDDEIDSSIGGAQLGTGYRFDFGVTTGIEKVEIRNKIEVIFDLQGRAVENPTKGTYIINGKKVLVK